MTNQRDSGRYNQFTGQTTNDNVQVDFVWGNIPMQPNDDRGEDTLDPGLDSHIIATSEYEGFPAFITGDPYDDTTANTAVPNLIGLDSAGVDAALETADLSGSASTTASGATALNDGKVKTQSPSAGAKVNVGATVSYVTYAYVNPGNPIAGLRTNFVPAGWTLGLGDIVMYLVGRTVKPTVGEVIKITGNSNNSLNQGYNVITVENDDVFNTGGTAVQLTAFEKAYVDPNTNEGGVWQDYFA